MKPMVSVVMPIYNSAEFLAQSVGTLLTQTMTDFELILVDDGSRDDSLWMLQNFQENDARLKVIQQENQGAGIARNTGMEVARGKYILFLDSDDYFSPNLLEILVDKAEQSGADVTICRASCFDHQTGKVLPSEWLRKDEFLKGKEVFSPDEMCDCLFQFTYGLTWDKLFRLEYLRAHGLIFPNLTHSEDLVFVYPALVCASGIAVVFAPLVHYRMKRSSSVSNTRSVSLEEVWSCMDLFEKWLRQAGYYDRFEQSFLNWAMEFCVWNVANLPNRGQRKQAYDVAKIDRLKRYQFCKFPKSYYFNRVTWYKHQLLRVCPFSLFSAIVDGYHKCKGILN